MTADEEPRRGGIFIRLSRLARRVEVAVPVIEELYGPTRRDARRQVEEQRQSAEAVPAPGDLPAAPTDQAG